MAAAASTSPSAAPTTYRVYRTAFHGGGLVSSHKTEAAAEEAARRARGNTACTCGCFKVVPPYEEPALMTEQPEPHCAAERG